MCGSGIGGSAAKAQLAEQEHRSKNRHLAHVVKPTDIEFPFQGDVSWAALETAFPLVREHFQKLLTAMFLRKDACASDTWEENTATPGGWYGLSYGCIHYHTLWVWQGTVSTLRRRFWRWLGRKVFSTFRLMAPPERLEDEDALWGLAFFDPHPLPAFERSLKEMTAEGLLRKSHEGGEVMYYPTMLLARRVASAIRKLSAA